MQPKIATILEGFGIAKKEGEMIHAGAVIETSTKTVEEDGVTKNVAIEKATGKQLAYGEVEVIMSNSNIDRYNESILVDGIDLKQIKRNPVVLWGHDYGGLPIGRIVKIWKEGGDLKARIKLSVEVYDFAKQVYELILDGALNAVSIGGRVKKWSDDYMTIEELELYELSVVPVGAHPDALVTSKSIGAERSAALRKSYVDFSEKATLDKLKSMGETDINAHIQSLKALTSALERTLEQSAETEEDEPSENGQSKKVVRRYVLARSTAKQLDKQSELIIAAINNKLKKGD